MKWKCQGLLIETAIGESVLKILVLLYNLEVEISNIKSLESCFSNCQTKNIGKIGIVGIDVHTHILKFTFNYLKSEEHSFAKLFS